MKDAENSVRAMFVVATPKSRNPLKAEFLQRILNVSDQGLASLDIGTRFFAQGLFH